MRERPHPDETVGVFEGSNLTVGRGYTETYNYLSLDVLRLTYLSLSAQCNKRERAEY